jgi:26S proteasome regulatory subunit N11
MNAAGMGMGQSNAPTDAPVVDTAEQVYISSLALLKMLKHGRAGKSLKAHLKKRLSD